MANFGLRGPVGQSLTVDSLWPAVIGVAGTVCGVAVTQLANRRAEKARWDREKAARLEQWKREDQARWMADRRQVYADYLASLDDWNKTLQIALLKLRLTGKISGGLRNRVKNAATVNQKRYEIVSLMAPGAIVLLARECMVKHSTFDAYLHDPDLFSETEDDELDDLLEQTWTPTEKLRDAIRVDLGVDDANEPLTVFLDRARRQWWAERGVELSREVDKK